MADLIDRQELLDALHESLRNPKKQEQSAGIAAAEKKAQRMPAAEPKRGEWEWFVEKSFNGEVVEVDDYGWRCSHCKTPLADVVGGYWDDDSEKPSVNYCPYCGADMRGGSKNEL